MTDGLIKDPVQRNLTMQEIIKYNDIELQPLLGGREFGYRFLNHIKWAMAKFNFQYLLRIDDDYYLCLKRLLSELPNRPRENLVWGFYHCEVGITWMDEAFMIFSKDVIQNFLAQNKSTMLCHPHADQQIALWLKDIPNQIFFHDTRLHHSPPASFVPKFDKITNVCDSYLGVHGAYVDKMRYLGLNASDTAKDVSPIPDFSSFCKTRRFDYRVFNPQWRFEPKPCKDNATWNIESGIIYAGQENDQEHFWGRRKQQ